MGSLLLTSCDDILNNFLGGNKKKSSEESSLNNGAGYQGKQGATELSKEEWELAFSLEEFALRRNCHLEVKQDEREMKMDVDNGKFKIDVPSYEMSSIYMNFTGMSGKDIKGVQYYPNSDGTYSTQEDQEQLDLVMAELGLIYLDYSAFNYDSSSKMYKADSYHYECTYQGRSALSLDCSNCEVTIEDGFPKKLECTIVEGADGDRSGVHYEANFSKYNAITVRLPGNGDNGGNNGGSGNNGGNNGGNSNLPTINGTEITYDKLYERFVNRPTPNYSQARISVNMTAEGVKQSMSTEATLQNGVWVPDNPDFEEMELGSLIITEEMMQELGQDMSETGVEVKFYEKNLEAGYVIEMSESVLNSETNTQQQVNLQLHLDQYFYVTAEYIAMNDVYESVEITWVF